MPGGDKLGHCGVTTWVCTHEYVVQQPAGAIHLGKIDVPGLNRAVYVKEGKSKYDNVGAARQPPKSISEQIDRFHHISSP